MTRSFGEFLFDVPMFKDLDHSVLGDVSLVTRSMHAHAGDFLFEQGQQSDGMYLIQEGKVSIEVRTPGDEILQVAEASATDVVGEMALMDDGVRSASARVVEDITGYFISRQRFDMLKSDLRPAGIAITYRLTRSICNHSRELIEEIIGIHSAESGAATKVPLAQDYLTSDGWPCNHSVLRQFPTFIDFTDSEITTFINHHERLKVPSGVILFTRGEAANGVYIVLRGALKSGFSSAQKSIQFNIYGPGQMAGYPEVLEDKARIADLTTRERSELIFLPAKHFRELSQQQTPAMFKLLANLGTQSVSQLRKINNIASRMASFERFMH